MAPLPPGTIARRYALWLVICAVSAAPSFALAYSMHASPAGMLAAVLLFAVAYGAASCTAWFERLHRRPFVRATMYVGYGLRLALSLFSALAVVAPGSPLSIGMAPDVLCGIGSVQLTSAIFGDGSNGRDLLDTFPGAFATTCVQGALLNVVVFVVMAVAYGLQRAFRRNPDHQPRGFEVLPPPTA